MHQESHDNMARYAHQYLPQVLRKLLDVGGRRVAPHDLSYRSVVRAEQYVGVDMQPGVCVDTVARAEALPFSDGVFDAVLCGQVLEHVRNPFKIVEEIARVLRRGGKALLVAPQVWRVHRYPIDTFRYNPDGMAALIEETGMRVLEVDTVLVAGGRSDCWGVGEAVV